MEDELQTTTVSVCLAYAYSFQSSSEHLLPSVCAAPAAYPASAARSRYDSKSDSLTRPDFLSGGWDSGTPQRALAGLQHHPQFFDRQPPLGDLPFRPYPGRRMKGAPTFGRTEALGLSPVLPTVIVATAPRAT